MTDPAAAAVQDTMFRALAVLRVLLLVNTLALGWYRRDGLEHPGVALAFFVVLTAWTAISTWAYADRTRRGPLLLGGDLLVAVLGIGLSAWVKGPGFSATLPGFWVMIVVLAWAVRGTWQGGLLAAVVVCGTDVVTRGGVDQTGYGNLFLLLIGGPLVGFLCGMLQDTARERDAAERAAAAAEERARLARVVHDGVLQVLALVQRRGVEIGGETADLARLAGEQEVALRAMVQRQDPGPTTYAGRAGASAAAGRGEGPVVDLAELVSALQGRASPHVQVAVPGSRVELPRDRAEELLAVGGACLHNVADHVGPDATAWVLLEDLGDEVVLSVRDDGPGIVEGRLEQAVADGRLGVAESIRGRVAGLGGTATLLTAPGRGTEWEVRVPRDPRPASAPGGPRRRTTSERQ